MNLLTNNTIIKTKLIEYFKINLPSSDDKVDDAIYEKLVNETLLIIINGLNAYAKKHK